MRCSRGRPRSCSSSRSGATTGGTRCTCAPSWSSRSPSTTSRRAVSIPAGWRCGSRASSATVPTRGRPWPTPSPAYASCIGARVGRDRGIGASSLQLDVHGLEGCIVQILGQVCPRFIEPQELALLSVDLLSLAVGIRKLEVRVGQKNTNAGPVSVHHRLLAGPIGDANEGHAIIFQFNLVVLGVHLHRVRGPSLRLTFCRPGSAEGPATEEEQADDGEPGDEQPALTCHGRLQRVLGLRQQVCLAGIDVYRQGRLARSEEHTSELQSRLHLVCRLLLEKKKKKQILRTDKTTK